MIPLWTTAISPCEVCGCALPDVGLPCVAQRVCEIPVTASSLLARRLRGEIGDTRAVLTSRVRRGAPAVPLMTARPVES